MQFRHFCQKLVLSRFRRFCVRKKNLRVWRKNDKYQVWSLSFNFMLQVKRRNCIFSDEKDVENAEINAFKTYSQVDRNPMIPWFLVRYFVKNVCNFGKKIYGLQNALVYKYEVCNHPMLKKENCLLECRAKILLKTCGCLPYFYPRSILILMCFKWMDEHN